MCDSNKPEAGADSEPEATTTPDAFDHDDCGCPVCEAIIAAIAETATEPEPTNAEPEAPTPSTDEFVARNRARRESYEAGHDVGKAVAEAKAADALREAAAEVMAGATRIAKLEQALEDVLLSMYAMRHDPLWALSPDAAVKDTALTIIYLNALQTLGRKLPVDGEGA